MFERTRPKGRTRTAPRIIPPNGGMSSRPRPLAGPAPITQELPAVVESEITRELPRVHPSDLPTVHQHTALVPATALSGTLPLPVGYMPVPPSAQHNHAHVDPGSSLPQLRGRNVLAELKAVPDLTAAPQRIIAALGGPEPQVKDPTRRLSVRLFCAARDMARQRRAWCDEADARLRAQDARIAEFALRWEHDNEHWDRVAAVLKAKQEASDAGQLTKAYEDDGTAAALYKVDELSQVIVARARAKAGVR